MATTKKTTTKVELSLKEQVINVLIAKSITNNNCLAELSSRQFCIHDIKWSSKELVTRKTLQNWYDDLSGRIILIDLDTDVKEVLIQFLKAAQSKARFSTHNSTSAFSNAISFAEQEGHFEMIDFLTSYIY